MTERRFAQPCPHHSPSGCNSNECSPMGQNRLEGQRQLFGPGNWNTLNLGLRSRAERKGAKNCSPPKPTLNKTFQRTRNPPTLLPWGPPGSKSSGQVAKGLKGKPFQPMWSVFVVAKPRRSAEPLLTNALSPPLLYASHPPCPPI